MASKKPETSISTYRIVRKLIQSDKPWSLSEANKEWDLNRTAIQRARDDLIELDIVSVEEGKYNAKKFYVDYEKLGKFLPELYLSDFSVSSEFEGFLERYVRLYVRFNKSSTIQGMLRDDLVTSLRAYQETESLPEYLEQFLSVIGGEASGYDKRPLEIVESALEEE